MKQGLFGPYRFEGRQGAYDYVRQAGCIQFDPVDVVGKNAELTLQSRVRGFKKRDLHRLLYEDRLLVDYYDKELAIFPAEDWPYFERYRVLCRENAREFDGLAELEEEALSYIREHGAVSSASLPIAGDIRWHSSIHWSGNWHGTTKAARAALEQLYTTGDLVIHHKEGARKFYDLVERHLPAETLAADDPFPGEYEHAKWRIKRRVGAVGMLWNRNSAAYLGISGLTPETRGRMFDDLLEQGEIACVHVEGIRTPLYVLLDDCDLLRRAEDAELSSRRVEFLAPLDPLLWDRALIERIFGFKYTWEIYTPKDKRRYGYYVLPLLYGDRLVGRIEPVVRDGRIAVKGIWLEDGVRRTKKLNQAINSRLRRFARFNECAYEPIDLWEIDDERKR